MAGLAMLLSTPNLLAAEKGYDIQIGGVTCISCVPRAEAEFKNMDGVKSIKTDVKKGEVKICTDASVAFTESQLTAIFRQRGFAFKSMSVKDNCL
ncbi:MAG: heavy-metal-associated domain-containing protein [Thiomicrospira sp.]|uniref:heavy-metal-associated domain-containing protein n=1 Tax=Thiomicrospira sp. TaxID=935 RepID=UPI001A0BF0FA|nr:heavy metal-associated domain-containing protein [Thiomicrospira sp.]MBE0492784.1 heavy-metal-associated domain-containing protein [Thiomicrospira sp.]